MRKVIFLGLILAMAVGWWGCSRHNLKRPLAGTMDAGIVGPEGEVILFYFERIEGRSFTMGSPKVEAGRDDDEGRVSVSISKDFEIMATEVTQMQWFRIMGFNPSIFKTRDDCDNHIIKEEEELCPSHPVENVSWDDVQKYIKTLNDRRGISGCHGTPRDATGCYRLPTEAEWELAARGKTSGGEVTTTRYFFGNSDSLLDDYAWYDKNSGRRTHQVKLKKANSYGLYDMSGNVWEWVQDRYGKSLPGDIDPLRSSSGSYQKLPAY